MPGVLRLRRAPLFVAVAALLVQGCAGAPVELAAHRVQLAAPVQTAEPQPPPSPTPDPLAVPDDVQTPRIWVRGVTDPAQAVPDALGVQGVAWAATARMGVISMSGARGPVRVQVAAVDPGAFRRLASAQTARSTDVWRGLLDGDAAVTPRVAWLLRVAPGDAVVAAGRVQLRVGSVAETVDVPLVDLLISRQRADSIRLGGEETLLVAVQSGTSTQAVLRRLRDAGFAAEVLPEAGAGGRQHTVEPFEYYPLAGGMIEIHPGWVRRHIVTARVPILGAVTCHRIMIPQLRAAMQEIEDAGLADLIDRRQYGGCWTPRHIDFNPSKSVSMHAWGLAIDINVSTNQLGAQPQLDARIVEIFEHWGFVWGGRWSRPDGMHFQLGSIIDFDHVEG